MANQELFNGTDKNAIADDERLAFNAPGILGALNITWLNFKALLTTLYVNLTSAQTVGGIKTFSASPVVPDPTTNLQAVNLRTLNTSITNAIFSETVNVVDADFTGDIYTITSENVAKYYSFDLTASSTAKTIKIVDASTLNVSKQTGIEYNAGSVLLSITTVGGTQLIGGEISQSFNGPTESITLRDNETYYIISQDSRLKTTDKTLVITDGLTSHLGNLSEHIAHAASPYISIGAETTDNGDGTITITEGEASIKISNNLDADFIAVVVAEDTFTIAEDTNVILYIDYNSGTPIYAQQVSTAGYFYSNWDAIPFATVVNDGTKIIVNDFRETATNGTYKNILGQINYAPFRYLGGLGASDAGTRNPKTAAGAFLFSNEYYPIAEFDTSGSDTFTRMFVTAGVWTRTTGQTTIDNTDYNDVATGMTALANTTKYANKFLYHIKDSPSYWAVLEGQTQYDNLTDAQEGGIPASLPPELNAFYAGAELVAKFIIRKSAAAFADIQNPFETQFSGSTASLHDNLGGLSTAGTGVTQGHVDNAKGFQFPELTTTERDALATVNAGMKIYNTTVSLFQKYDGSAWINEGEFLSTIFKIKDVTDPTKILQLLLSGITTATTRTLTIQDKSGTIAHLDDLVSLGADNQIPVMNAGGTDFEYSAKFLWDGIRLIIEDSANKNIFIGDGAGSASAATAVGNIVLGEGSGAALTDGDINIIIGYYAGSSLTEGDDNVIIGDGAGDSLIAGNSNVFLGNAAGRSNIGSSNVFLGALAGFRETGSNKFFIDNNGRTSEVLARSEALMYGVFSTTVADQELAINAKLTLGVTPSTGTTSDPVLVRNASTGEVKEVAQSGLGSTTIISSESPTATGLLATSIPTGYSLVSLIVNNTNVSAKLVRMGTDSGFTDICLDNSRPNGYSQMPISQDVESTTFVGHGFFGSATAATPLYFDTDGDATDLTFHFRFEKVLDI